MTLRRRLVMQLGVLLLWLIVTAGVGLWGINGLKQDYSVALDNHEQIRRLYEVGFHLSTARQMSTMGFGDQARRKREIDSAVEQFTLYANTEKESTRDQAILKTLKRASMDHSVDVPLSALAPLLEEQRQHIQAIQDVADLRRLRALQLLLMVSCASVVGAIVVGYLLYRAVMNPLTKLGAGAREMARGAMQQKIETRQTDKEFADVATDFNHMASELRMLYDNLNERVATTTNKLVQSEKLAGVGYLAAGVAHEMNNPLSIITGYAELWLKEPMPDQAGKTLELIKEEAYRCRDIVNKLLSLARQDNSQRRKIDLKHLIRETLDTLNGLPAQRGKQLSYELCDQDIILDGVHDEIKQVLINLVINALQAVGENGQVLVRCTAESKIAKIEVIDNGQGMTQDVLHRIFEPFYSVPGTGEVRGTGLGLSITQALVLAHDGTIEARSAGLGKGSQFVVCLPIQSANENAIFEKNER